MDDIGLVKQRLAIMADRGASIEKMRAYTKAQGYTVEQIREYKPQSVAGDMVKGGASGLARGAIGMAGLAGDVSEMGGKGVEWLAGKLGAGDGTAATIGNVARRMTPLPTSQMPTSEGISDAIGFEGYDPTTRPGKFAETIFSFLPGAVAGGGVMGGARGALGAAMRYGVAPGVASEAAGQMAEGSEALGVPLEPVARVGAALATPSVMGAVKRAITPLPRSQNYRDATRRLEQAGVKSLSPAQKSGSREMRRFEVQRGGSRARNLSEESKEQLTSSVLKKAGINAERATDDVMAAAADDFGRRFDAVAKGKNVRADGLLKMEFDMAANEYAQQVSSAAKSPQVQKFAADIDAFAQGGKPISGEWFQNTQSVLGKRAAAAAKSGDVMLADTLFSMQNSLHRAFERTLNAQGMKGTFDKWKELRDQYRHFVVLAKVMGRAGEDALEGLVSPKQLRSVSSQQGGRNYVYGRAPYARQGKDAALVMPDPNSSGTAENMKALGVGDTLWGDVKGVVPWLAARLSLSPLGRSYMTNDIMSAPAPTNRFMQGYGGTIPLRDKDRR